MTSNGSSDGVDNETILSNSCIEIGDDLSFKLDSLSLLKPDSKEVERMFSEGESTWPSAEVRDLLKLYFDRTERASDMYRALLGSIIRAKQNQKSIDEALKLVSEGGDNPSKRIHGKVLKELGKFAATDNPFSREDFDQFQTVHDDYDQMGIQLEHMKTILSTKLRRNERRKKFVPFLLVANGGPLLVCAAVPAAMKCIGISEPGAAKISLDSWRSRLRAIKHRYDNVELEVQYAQLEEASKGTYSIFQVLKTVNCLVTRLRNDVESTKSRICFCEKRREDYRAVRVVADQLRKHQGSFRSQLQEFRGHIKFSCETLNKARIIVVQQITASPWQGSMRMDSLSSLLELS